MDDETDDVGSPTSGSPSFTFDFAATTSDSGEPDDNERGTTVRDAIDPAGKLGDGPTDATGQRFDSNRHIGPDKFNRDGSFSRKRGRRGTGGSGQKSNKTSAKTSVAGIETVLVGIHAMMGAALAPELALEADESKPYAEAVVEVAKHYDVPVIADKTLAWCALLLVMGRIYGPRYVLIRQRLREENAKNVTEDPTVVPFYRGPAGGFDTAS